MLRIASNQIPYHGWHIEIGSIEGEFYFQCYHPTLSTPINDGLTYPSFRIALVNASEFIDREMAVHALTVVVGDWLFSGKISDEEYWHLTDFA